MKIYKFKDLRDERKHSHFLQIVLENAIWCARPDTLNDEDEFKFKLDYEPSPNTEKLLSQVITQYRTTNHFPPHVLASLALENKTLENRASPIINDVVHQCRNTIGIISFSLRKTDAHLWEEYGGKGNGVCIGINIPESLVGLSYHRVHYVPEKIFHVDSFLESVLFSDRAFETYKNILLTKTKKWTEEEEIRFVGNRQNVNLIVDGYISEVTFGPHVPPITLERLTANIAGHCSTSNIKLSEL
jgi:Protein of unknown function (DUF2971)